MDNPDMHAMMGTVIQVCFCGPRDGSGVPTELLCEPLDQHDVGCLVWDWALAHRKITPAQRMEQLDAYAARLGLAGK